MRSCAGADGRPRGLGVRAARPEDRFTPESCRRERTWALPAGRPPLVTPAQDEPSHRSDLSPAAARSRVGPPSTLRRATGFHGTAAPRVGPVSPLPPASVHTENRGAEAVWDSALDTSTHACPLPPAPGLVSPEAGLPSTAHRSLGPGTPSAGDSGALPRENREPRFVLFCSSRSPL